MGARQSKKSLDITTPKKEGEIVAEGGEGTLTEKNQEIDVNAVTNGELHSESELTGKDTDKADEVKENGLPEDSDAKTPDAEVSAAASVGDQAAASASSESTVANEEKIEKVESEEKKDNVGDSSSKKSKDKSNKKKKFSFRSISFSKKDKSKPKESDKNGDVKEVAEEKAEAENVAATESAPAPVAAAVAEPVENGDAKPEEIAKVTVETTPPVEQPEEQLESKQPEKPAADVAEIEPIVASSPVVTAEQTLAAPVATEDKIIEESTSEPERPSEETKVEESPVVVAAAAAASVASAESQPAETLEVSTTESTSNVVVPSAVVPAEKEEEINETNKEVGSIAEDVPPPLPSSQPPSPVTVFAESTKADYDNLDLPPPSLLPSETSSVSIDSKDLEQQEAAKDIQSISAPTAAVEQEHVTEIVVNYECASSIPSSPVVQQLTENQDDVGCARSNAIPFEVTTETGSDVETTQHKHVIDLIVPQDILSPPRSDTALVSDDESSTQQESVVDVPDQSESVVVDDVPSIPSSVAECLEQPESSDQVKISAIESHSELSNDSVVVSNDSSDSLATTTAVAENGAISKSGVEDLAETNENDAVEPAVVVEDIPLPPLVIELVEQHQENIVVNNVPESNAHDSLPDISTESLPSLPEPLSESLPEPMSLPPVETIPEPIITHTVEVVNDVELLSNDSQQHIPEENHADIPADLPSPASSPTQIKDLIINGNDTTHIVLMNGGTSQIIDDRLPTSTSSPVIANDDVDSSILPPPVEGETSLKQQIAAEQPTEKPELNCSDKVIATTPSTTATVEE